jgi:hypothetical protein
MEESLVFRGILGDGAAVAELIRMIIRNRLEYESNLDICQMRYYEMTVEVMRKLNKATAEIPILKTRSRRLQETLARVPESAFPTLAKTASEWSGEFAMECLLNLLADRTGDKLSDESTKALLAFLHDTRIPEVRALCVRRLLPRHQTEVTAALETLSAADRESAVFALSQLPLLPTESHATIARKASAHPDEEVKAKAARYLVP